MIVTFYSYKGGTGRTMAMANIACLLAIRGKRVLAVDFDLEAPGLWRFFSRFNEDLQQRKGLIDLLLAASSATDPLQVDWRSYVTKVSFRSNSLSLMTSGQMDNEYPSKVLSFDWTAFFQDSKGGDFIERMRGQWRDEYDFILIDSRTGITDTGGICTILLPDSIVPVFVSNFQSLEGVADVIARAQAQRNNLAYDRPPAVILPIFSRFESRTEYESAQEWLDIAADRLKPFYSDWLPQRFSPRQALERTKLPYVAYFSFGETLPVLTEGISDPESLGYALNSVAELIDNEFKNYELVMSGGGAVSGKLARQAPSEASPWDFFVSYAQADQAWAEWIAWTLEEDGYRVLVQAWDFVPGANWIQSIQGGIREATCTIAVLSPDYLDSVYGSVEWRAAWSAESDGSQRKLLTVRVKDSDRPPGLAEVVGVDLFGITEEAAKATLRRMVSAAVVSRAKPDMAPDFPVERRTMPAARFPGALPQVWKVPARNPNFTGRDSELESLAQGLAVGSAVTVHSVHGMGGVGKTRLAAEYAYAHAGDYDLVWWVAAEEPASIPDQFAALAARLGLDPVADPEALRALVHDRLRSVPGWLLIFDNADRVEDIRQWLPVGPLPPGIPGHVIVTTRRGGFAAMGRVLNLDVIDLPDAVRMLRSRVPDLGQDVGEQIAEELGRLPLALEQAAAYLDRSQMPGQEYLRLLRDRGVDLYARGQVSDRADTIATLWDISVGRITAESLATVQLLDVCAYLAPEPIPIDLFTNHRDQLPEPLSSAAADPLSFGDAIAVLVDYSLAIRSSAGLQLHRLVQATIRARHSRTAPHREGFPRMSGEVEDPLAVALRLLRADAPPHIIGAPQYWPRWAELLPHVLAATAHADRASGQPEPEVMVDVSWLLNRAGSYLQVQAQFAHAKALLERSLAIDEAAYGPDHPDVARDLANLGTLLQDLGQPEAALPLQERALAIDEAAYGLDHPDVARDLDNLALTYRDLGQADKALPLQERALAIDEVAYGPDHPDVARDLDNLALTYADLGQADRALPLQQRALQITEAALGPDHPSTAIRLDNLALTYADRGQADRALPLQERALAIDEAAYGPDHPDVARDLDNLAATYRDLGQADRALPLQQRALQITEAALGPDHPSTAIRLDNLAATYRDLGQADRALPLQQRALQITEAALGPDHPSTAIRLDNLAATYRDLGQADRALPLQQRALQITEAALGPDHPSTAIRLDNLAATYRDLGQADKALPLAQRAQRITETALVHGHLDTEP